MVTNTEGQETSKRLESTQDNSEGDSGSDAAAENSADEEERQLTKDEIFAVLKNSRRRETLHYLEDNGGSGELGTLAEQIAAKENSIEIRDVSSTQRKRVYIGLYQVHLPKMDDVGVIDFNKHRGRITLTDMAQRLYPYLHLDPEEAVEDSTKPVSKTLGTLRSQLQGLTGRENEE